MLNTTIKCLLSGMVGAIALTGTLFVLLPETEDYKPKATETQATEYSRDLYGIPKLDLDHYKLSDDKYFDFVLDGDISVGRENPVKLNTWYKKIAKNPESVTEKDELRGNIEKAIVHGDSDKLLNSLGELVEESRSPEDAPIENTDAAENKSSGDSTLDIIDDMVGEESTLSTGDNKTGESITVESTLVGKDVAKLDNVVTAYKREVASVKDLTLKPLIDKNTFTGDELKTIEESINKSMTTENVIYVYGEFLQNLAYTMGEKAEKQTHVGFGGYKTTETLFNVFNTYRNAYATLQDTVPEKYKEAISKLDNLEKKTDNLRNHYNQQFTSAAYDLDKAKTEFNTAQQEFITTVKGIN